MCIKIENAFAQFWPFHLVLYDDLCFYSTGQLLMASVYPVISMKFLLHGPWIIHPFRDFQDHPLSQDVDRPPTLGPSAVDSGRSQFRQRHRDDWGWLDEHAQGRVDDRVVRQENVWTLVLFSSPPSTSHLKKASDHRNDWITIQGYPT